MTSFLSANPDISVVDALSIWLENRLADLHTALPAKVVAYDPATQSADVQPIWQRKIELPDGEVVSIGMPQVNKAPVYMPAGGGFRVSFPLQAGDFVMLLVAQRSLDAWLNSPTPEEVNAPGDPRKHSLSDAMVIPGIRPYARALPGTDGDLVVGQEAATEGAAGPSELRIKPDGTVMVSAGGEADDVMVRGNALNVWLTTKLSVSTAVGPSGPAVTGLGPDELSALAKVR